MFITGISSFLIFVAALVYTSLFVGPLRRRLSDAWRNRALVVVVVVGFVAHVNVLHWDADRGLRVEPPVPHLHELYHYYVGSKYFAELGHTGLYEATVIADVEDAPASFRPLGRIRDLRTNRMVEPRGAVVVRAPIVKAPFSPDRWESFKRDVALLRGWTKESYWFETGFLVDHGYNGTPILTAVLGGLANSGLVTLEDFTGWLRWLDIYLLFMLAVFMMGIDAPLTGLGFLAFAFLNPLHEYGFIGNAYLRTDYLLPLTLGVLGLRLGWQKTSGALLALSGWIRVFPLLLLALVGLRDLARRDALAQLRARAPFWAGALATSAAIVVLGSMTTSPDGGNAWAVFARNIASHSEELSVNRIGVNELVLYAGASGEPGLDGQSKGREAGEADRIRIHSERRPVGLAVSGLLVALAIYLTIKSPLAWLPISWMVLLFGIQPLSHYYWAILALLPVMAGPDLRWHALGGVTLAGLALTASPLLSVEAGGLRFAVYNVVILAFLLAASALILFRSQEVLRAEPA